jgi:Carboxypeptidase regulatory-like domain
MFLRRFVLSVCLVLLPVVAQAQEFRGTLSGRVIDPQQASVAGAKISVVQNETGAKFSTASSADGSYVVPFLPPGPYTVSAEAPGFKKYINHNIRIQTNEREQVYPARSRHDRSVRNGLRGSFDAGHGDRVDGPGAQHAADREHAD